VSAPVSLSLLPDTAEIDADGSLRVGGCSILPLAEQHGTPLFVYDEEHLRNRCREAVSAFGADRAVYATKAFLCRAMARLASEEGLLLDVASGGELHVALAAGVPPERCVLHGNNKSVEELRFALRAGVRHINVDSFEELARIESLVAQGAAAPPKVQLRITPGVHAHTHEYIATGQDDSKFGFNLANGDAEAAVRQAKDSRAMDVVGLHCHIGSNVFAAESFGKAAEVMATFAKQFALPELTLGGGLGVAYVTGESAPTIAEWGKTVLDAVASTGLDAAVSVEPGRSIVAGAALTLYTVGVVKRIPNIRTYIAVDGGMSDNPRPVLYGSGYEAFLPREVAAERPRRARIVGKHCESGDVLISNASIPADVAVGDILATPVTGAYGRSMASNYNMITRPPVVFVRDGTARLVLRRETYDDLLACDIG
jgi:diaminopimelate decarboxylase